MAHPNKTDSNGKTRELPGEINRFTNSRAIAVQPAEPDDEFQSAGASRI